MAGSRRCDVCGKTESEGLWTLYVRSRWPFIVPVCGECYTKHIALRRAAWAAWPGKLLWTAIVLVAVSLVLIHWYKQIAGVLPITLVDIPEPRRIKVKNLPAVRITHDGREYVVPAGPGVIVSHEETLRARERNERLKQHILFLTGTLSSFGGVGLFWYSYRRARRKALRGPAK